MLNRHKSYYILNAKNMKQHYQTNIPDNLNKPHLEKELCRHCLEVFVCGHLMR